MSASAELLAQKCRVNRDHQVKSEVREQTGFERLAKRLPEIVKMCRGKREIRAASPFLSCFRTERNPEPLHIDTLARYIDSANYVLTSVRLDWNNWCRYAERGCLQIKPQLIGNSVLRVKRGQTCRTFISCPVYDTPLNTLTMTWILSFDHSPFFHVYTPKAQCQLSKPKNHSMAFPGIYRHHRPNFTFFWWYRHAVR